MKRKIGIGLLMVMMFLWIGLINRNKVDENDANAGYIICDLKDYRNHSFDEMLEGNHYFHVLYKIYKEDDLLTDIQMRQIDVIEHQKEEVQSILPDICMDDGDIHILLQLVAAEAGTEDIIGKALVLCVIKNRLESQEFPNTIREVIYQHDNGVYQFSPVRNEAYQNVEVTSECFEALDLVLSGWDESNGAVYFCTSSVAEKWHERHLTFLFVHGSHRFYKR